MSVSYSPTAPRSELCLACVEYKKERIPLHAQDDKWAWDLKLPWAALAIALLPGQQVPDQVSLSPLMFFAQLQHLWNECFGQEKAMLPSSAAEFLWLWAGLGSVCGSEVTVLTEAQSSWQCSAGGLCEGLEAGKGGARIIGAD